MGVDLMIFSNHKIKGVTYEERIKDIENKLGKSIQILRNIPHKRENEPPKTNKVKDVIYYIDVDDGKDYFEELNEIPIQLNFEYFTGLRIFDKTLEMHMGLSSKYSKWLNYLGDDYEKKRNPKESIEYNRRWNEFKKFQFHLISKLGGDKIVYFNDASFQEPEDLFYQGRELNEILPELEKVGTFLEIQNLYTKYESIEDDDEISNVGFYEKIK